MLVSDKLFSMLKAALGNPTDEKKMPVMSLPQLKAFADAFVNGLKASQTIHMAIGGSGLAVNAPSPDAGKLVGGSAMAGKIINLNPQLIATQMIQGAQSALNPQATANITKSVSTITTYIMASGLVNFSAGSVTGNCTAITGSSPAPGVLVAAKGEKGKIQGLVGSALMAQMSAVQGPLPNLLSYCNAICDFVVQNAQVDYLPQTINGAFPSGGGAVIGGTAVSGVIS